MRQSRYEIIKKCKEKLKELKLQYQAARIDERDQDSSFFRDRMRVLLPEIKSALVRIEQGNYGLCEITGEEIENNRLLAVPWTRISIKALKQEAV